MLPELEEEGEVADEVREPELVDPDVDPVAEPLVEAEGVRVDDDPDEDGEELDVDPEPVELEGLDDVELCAARPSGNEAAVATSRSLRI
jgi:hypothetical protein